MGVDVWEVDQFVGEDVVLEELSDEGEEGRVLWRRLLYQITIRLKVDPMVSSRVSLGNGLK